MKRFISIFMTLTIIISSGIVSHAERESEEVDISFDEKLYESNAAYENEEIGYDSFSLFSTDEYPNDLESMRARAEEIVNYKWVPSQDIHKWNSSAVFKKGSTVTGMPYTLFVSSDIGHDPLLSLKQYKTKSNSNKSTTHYCISVGATRTGPIYGSCCATFISNVLGGYFMNGDNPRFDACSQFKNKSGSHAKVFTGKVGSIKEGDALINNECHHIIWVGKITDKNITIYEQTPPVARKKTVSKPSSDSYFTYHGATYKTIVRPEMTTKVNKPSAPSITKGEELSDSSIKITWGSVNGASSYRVDMRRTDESDYKTVKKDLSSTTYTASNLKANSTYFFRVYATNSAGTSSRSVTYEVHTKPIAPAQPKVTSISDTELKIEWDAVANVDKYKLEYKKWNGEWSTLKSNINGTSYSHKNLEPGTRYKYRVSAVKEGNIGPEGNRKTHNYTSNTSDIKTKFTKLSRPSNKHNENNDAYIDLTWKKVSGDKTYVYDVYRDGQPIANNLSDAKYTDTGATSGVIHAYCIKVYENDSNHNHVASSETFYAGNKITNRMSLTPQSPTSMKITWERPSSNIGLKYIVKKRNNEDTDWIDLATTTDTYYVDNTVSAGNTYKYYIQIRDNANNYITSISNKSAILNIEPDRVAINNTSISLTEDDSASLSATVYPDNSFDKSVTWSSSDSDVAEVISNGTVTAKSAGTAIITAKTSNNKTAQCTVTVAAKATAHTHVYGEWIVETEATCETDGTKYRECSCGDKEKGVIYATGHSYSEEWTVIKEANCHEEGEKAHVCSICGNETDNTIIEKTAHNFGDWVREENSSCSAEGKETRTCSICGDAEERATDVTNHDYVLTNETQPTLDAPGTRTYVCSVCGDVHTEEWVETISAGTIKIGGTIANPGETLTVPVSIEDNPGFAGFTFDVKYDETAVTPVEIIKSDLTESGTFEMNVELNEEGETVARVTWFTSQNMTDNGELFNIQFKVNNNAQQGRYPVSIMGEISNDELSNVIPDILTDYITVGDYLKGDVNLDKVVNGEDATLLARYIVAGKAKQQTMFSERQRKAANVYDSDKDVLNHKDGIRLSQIIAGYDISLLEKGDIKLMSNAAASVTIESFDAVPGSEVYVPIYIEDNPGIAGFNMHLDYDEDKLTLMSIERDEIIQDGRFETTLGERSDNGASDGVDIYWIDSDNITDDGVLFYAVFEVSDAATIGEVLPVEIDTNTVDFSDMYLDSVSTEITQGTVTLAEYLEDNPDDYESAWMPYDISNVSMSGDGNTVEDIPTNGNFDVNVDFSVNDEEAELGTVIVAVYDENGSLINVSSRDMTADMITAGVCGLHINESENTIADIKVFIWNSLGGMQAMSDYVRISSDL